MKRNIVSLIPFKNNDEGFVATLNGVEEKKMCDYISVAVYPFFYL